MFDVLIAFVVGAAWMLALMFTHDYSFAEFFCRNCRDRDLSPQESDHAS